MLRALEMGAVETLICWENLDVQRITLKNHSSGEEKILHLTSEQEKDKTHFTDMGKFLVYYSTFQFILRRERKSNSIQNYVVKYWQQI